MVYSKRYGKLYCSFFPFRKRGSGKGKGIRYFATVWGGGGGEGGGRSAPPPPPSLPRFILWTITRTRNFLPLGQMLCF